MPGYFAALTIVLMLGMVAARVLLLKRQGTKAMKFGDVDKKDFLIPPFALFYFYMVFASAFGLPAPSTEEIFHSGILSWVGVASCLAGLGLLLWSLVSFGKSFRVGIDTPSRQTCNEWYFRPQPQPDLCGICADTDRRVPDFLQLDTPGLYRRSRMALSPSGFTRRRISAEALWSGIHRLSQPGEKVLMSLYFVASCGT